MAKVQRTKKTDKTSGLSTIRHSASHIMAEAILNLYPETKLGFGPATEDGFYYDFDFKTPITDEDLTKIEAEMIQLIGLGRTFERSEKTITEALKWADKNNQSYKADLIGRLKERGEKKVSFYTSGKFTDLCEGPHIKSTKAIGAFKLLSLAGAYWHGNEKNPQLTRIYGTAFATQKELDEYLVLLEESKKRDHRKLGKELELFAFDDDVGPGLPLWLPKGTVIVEELEKLAKVTESANNYLRVRTPHIAKESMYRTSGHLPYYEDTMYPPMEMEGTKYYLKAMNCPHHHKIFAAMPRSYRDLPLRLAEYGTCYRYEKSGELMGLMRVRMLSMNDAHIYCTKVQFAAEFEAVNQMYIKYFKLFGIDKYVMRFSTHDPEKLGQKYVDEPKLWQETEALVRKVLKESKIPYVEVPNEAAFYGPKIDVEVWNTIGREFTLATNQVDFAQPRRFGLTYTNEKGEPEIPLCIHRAPLGTHERFIGFLIEHYAGAFPFWLAPVQAMITPISDKQNKYATQLLQRLKTAGVRAELDDRNESLGRKIRDAEVQKVPLVLVIGPKEVESKSVTLRDRDKGDLGSLPIEDAITRLQQAADQVR
ncbi:threonine--tRNA ligase [candidate division Kazan bacterium RIFCSPHIGHO2_01_FULL_49_10]|uniref:Threonine--tRNA ligase n=1 Tax=candidate division Kazan bacterium RIFCSPLOWO2_01_FULL_48_13 TaxID=1798539 RepID=A0A1F4PPV6_UNCK3|nr:MAG: threonine--tRNA ligase [candidate division Kazan bacterium RIFCSPHIGHO2_01_FULL_49_10]OGB85688.1 MAG: threonine--tRNA ligase [candidate division Kazan bacterium RIFCSPLOWO2_01_FULL_48_13]